MTSGFRRHLGIVTLLAWTGFLSGCVERRFVVNSEPAGAVVFVNGRPLSASPADDHFVYYGNYHFTLIKDGYQTLQVDQYVAPPWYQFPGLDFISENLVPWKIRDVRPFYYKMLPLEVPNTKKLQEDAAALRGRGQAIQPPLPEPGESAVPAALVPVTTGPGPR